MRQNGGPLIGVCLLVSFPPQPLGGQRKVGERVATNPDRERARILATLAADAADTADAIREDPTILSDASWVASFAALWTSVSVLADAVSVIECHAEQPCQDCQQRAYKRAIAPS